MSRICVSRLALTNFKSIERCDLDLGPLTLLVGRNGAGKSNILDSLRFTADALRNTLEYAIRDRGGIDSIRRRTRSGRPTNPSIGLTVSLAGGASAVYEFCIGAVAGRTFEVTSERCEVRSATGRAVAWLRTRRGAAEWSLPFPPPSTSRDRLMLVAASGTDEFRMVFDALTRMTFHNLNPDAMRHPQKPDPSPLLAHDGRNLASIVKRLADTDGNPLRRVADYLQAIGTPILDIGYKPAGSLETVVVTQHATGGDRAGPSEFEAISLSDGTLRALGILVSLASARAAGAGSPTLIGIEEPETSLHPAAAGAMLDALLEATTTAQLVVTTHSPDLLEHDAITPEMIRPVILEEGRTVAGSLDPARGALLRNHLSTAGELLRLDQLEPDPEDVRRQQEKRNTLFEGIQ